MLEQIKADLVRVAGLLGIATIDLTRDKYIKCEDAAFEKTVFAQFGGFKAVKRDLFGAVEAPHGDSPTDLASIRGTQERNAYVTKLRRELGTHLQQAERLYDSMRRALEAVPLHEVAPRKFVTKPSKKTNRVNVVTLSDNHFGLLVDPSEVTGGNYTWLVAARRLGEIARQTAHFKQDHRVECERLILNVAGDLIQGIIHADSQDVDLVTYQVVGAARYLIDFIDYQLNFYNLIDVNGTPGNHDRILTLTKGAKKQTAQKYDSFFTMIMEAVQQAFRREPRVQFELPKTPYVSYQVFGRHFFLTHSDTVLTVGNPGQSINVGAIAAKINDFNAGLFANNPIKVCIVGHMHTALYVGLPNGTDFFQNSSMSGMEPFVQSIGRVTNRVGQWIFESTKEFCVGDKRQIWLTAAVEADSSLDEIIRPFDYELTAHKGAQ